MNDPVSRRPPVDPSRYRAMLDGLHDAVLVMSSVRDDRGVIVDLRYEFANAQALTNMGFTEGDLLGRTMLDLFPSHRELGLFEQYAAVIDTGEPLVLEVPWFEEGNLAGSWQISSSKLDDGSITVCRDATTQALAAAALRDRERLFRILADHAADLAFVVKEQRIRWVSPSVTAILGWDPDEVLGCEPQDFVHPDDGWTVGARREMLVASGSLKTRLRVRCKSGDWLWLDVGARFAGDHDGDLAGATILCAWDAHTEVEALSRLAIAERERSELEARFQQAARLDSLGVLAGGVAHDFNNLLASILGNAELAQRSVDDAVAVGPRLAGIVAAAEEAAALTQQMLDYAGQRTVESRCIDVVALIGDTERLLRSVVPRTTHVEIRTGDDLPLVCGDPSQLRQVIMNLVLNGADALAEGLGRVTIEVTSDLLSAAQLDRVAPEADLAPGRYLRIDVSDTGRGIEPETRARIFEPFFTTKRSGRGLGLAVVHGVVQRHAGAIEIVSAPGAGTTMTVWLPAAAVSDDVPVPPAASPPPSSGRARRVLVVDDESNVLSLVAEALDAEGFEVVAEHEPSAALAHFTASPDDYDVVILDVTMPKMNGRDLLTALRTIRPGLPAVYMSGRSGADVEPLPVRTTFLQKPFRIATVLDALAAVTAIAPVTAALVP